MSRFVSRSVRICALAVTLPLLGGCANYIFNKFDIDGSSDSLSIDAKQRVILSTREGGKTRDRKIVCAEASPDAFSAIGQSVAASGGLQSPTGGSGSTQQASGGGGFSGGSSESAASLAMRTQTIQLLRDGYYRLCEAYMNGAIDQHQYNIVLLNIDKLMVTLLGVDGIAGTRNVSPVAIAAHAPALKTGGGAGASPTGNAEVLAPAGNPPTELSIKEVSFPAPGAVQSEAIANIVLHANDQSAVPSLCISLLASGELRLDNPGQHSVLKACDYLLQGAVKRRVHSPPQPRPTYAVSRNASHAQHPPAKQ